MASENKVTVYAVGGCGINVVFPLMQIAAKGERGYADLTFGLVDTSHSNLPTHGFTSNFIHVGDRHKRTDGSGKIRTVNLGPAKQAVVDILSHWEPGDLNIVVHSASGGSGSMIANVLVNDLLNKGKEVVVIMVGSSTCVKEADNTVATIHTYNDIAVTLNRPVPCYYLDNKDRSMEENNERARAFLLLLTAIWSGENKGLDRMDLRNFLNYSDVSQYEPEVSWLHVADSVDPSSDLIAHTASVVSIITEGEDPSPGVIVPYHSYGILDDEVKGLLKTPTPLHLMNCVGVFLDVLDEIEKITEAARNAKPVRTLRGAVSRSDITL